MENIYQKYKDFAEFRLVYIREAHALGTRRESPQAREYNIIDPSTYGERCLLASAFIDNEKLTIPTIVDDIENTVNDAYSAFPDRIFVVDTHGKIALVAERGPWGFKPGLEATAVWLAEFASRTTEESEEQRIKGLKGVDSSDKRD